MALSDARQWFWNRTGVYYAPNGASDLPSFDAGSTFNPGDLVFANTPAIGLPAMWICLLGGTAPTWAALAFAGTNTVTIISTAAGTATVNSQYVVMTYAGATTLSIPAATSFQSGTVLLISNQGTGSCTVTPVSGTINGSGTLTITTLTSARLLAIGTSNWLSIT